MISGVMQLVAAASDAGAFERWDWSGMSIVTYREAFNQSEWRQQARNARFKDPVQGGLEGIRMWGQQCDILLSDSSIIAQLKASPQSHHLPFHWSLCSVSVAAWVPCAISQHHSQVPGIYLANASYVGMSASAIVQSFDADLLFGDWGYFCTPALSEVLQIPRVTVSNIPIVDPLHTTWDRSTGRRMHVPNMLAYTPQVSTH